MDLVFWVFFLERERSVVVIRLHLYQFEIGQCPIFFLLFFNL